MRQILIAVSLSLAPFAIAQSAPAPDLILYNAKVFTGDAKSRFAQAVAITDDRISAVGTNDEVKAAATPSTKMIDATGHLIIPGLNSAHEHFCSTPSFAMTTGPDTTSAELLAALAGAIDETPSDVWLTGTIGPPVIDDPAITSAVIDKAAQGRRVLLFSFTGHAAIANSAALSSLRTNDSRDPAGGWWQRDASGRSTGKAFEYAATNLQRRWAELTSDDDATDAMHAWAEGAARLGVTTVQVMPCVAYKQFEKLARHASLPIRLRVIPMPMTFNDGRDTDELRTEPAPGAARSMLNVSGIKWILDGTPIERGAAMREPYPGTKENGRINFSNEEITSMLKEGIAANQQMLFHVIGDRTTSTLLDLMKAMGRTDWKERRVRIEHGDGITAEMIPAVRDFGIVVVENPTHQGPFAKTRLVKTLLKNGIPIAIGSDGPPLTPYQDLELAITNPSNPDEAITRDEAVDAYTRGSAFAELTEKDKGTIAPGKLADLAMLSQDIFTVSTSRIPETTSLLTIVGGKVVYDPSVISVPPARRGR
jgi:predicted amidohydrolase YtcJ